MGGRASRSQSWPVSGTQTTPEEYRMVKARSSGVASSAAKMRSPSFSRSSSSTATTGWPAGQLRSVRRRTRWRRNQPAVCRRQCPGVSPCSSVAAWLALLPSHSGGACCMGCLPVGRRWASIACLSPQVLPDWRPRVLPTDGHEIAPSGCSTIDDAKTFRACHALRRARWWVLATWSAAAAAASPYDHRAIRRTASSVRYAAMSGSRLSSNVTCGEWLLGA